MRFENRSRLNRLRCRALAATGIPDDRRTRCLIRNGPSRKDPLIPGHNWIADARREDTSNGFSRAGHHRITPWATREGRRRELPGRADQGSIGHQDDRNGCDAVAKVHPSGRPQSKIGDRGHRKGAHPKKQMISIVLVGRWASEVAHWPTKGRILPGTPLASSGSLQLCPISRVSRLNLQGVNVMGNDTTNICSHTEPKADNPGICGAMAQQRRIDGYDDNESTPQKFVHLVGCRDPSARKAPWARPRPTSPKP